MRVPRLTLLAAAGLLLSTAHAAAPEPKLPIPLDPAVFTGMLKSYRDCRARYAEIDARIDAAGVGDGSYYRVPGFPYFRTDRFAASYAAEVEGLDGIAGWMRRMREFDQEAREFEYRNLGMSEQEIAAWRFELLGCGSGLSQLELFEDDNLAFLRRQVVPASEFKADRPLLDKSSRQALAAREAELRRRFAEPLPVAGDKLALKLWHARPVEDLSLIAEGYGNAIADELGVPALIDSQWRAFAERHAPALWIESAGASDQPGMPVYQGATLGVDSDQPRLHYQITFTRFGELPLAQINYFIWLPGQAGGLDSLIWRVTLDARAQPLVYEYVQASGRDHLMFLAQPLTRRPASKHDSASPVPMPQAEPISGPVALRIAAGSHELMRVVPLAAAAGTDNHYQLARYEAVFTLAAGDGKTRSLYDANGLIPGVRDELQARLWGNAVRAPGALHVLGRLPVSPVGGAHFDDAHSLDRLFVAPKRKLAIRP